MTTNAYNIAVIAGDGIGNEVMPEAIKVLEAVGRKYDLSFKFDEAFPSDMYHLDQPTAFEILVNGRKLKCKSKVAEKYFEVVSNG